MTDERYAYLSLALAPGIGPARLAVLGRTFGSWTDALTAPPAIVRSLPELGARGAAGLSALDPALVDRVLASVAALGGFVLTPLDPEYPPLLARIDEPPPVLFGLGRRELLTVPAVAVVGSRHPTRYGVTVARELAGAAAEAGLVVVSGMARGLDAVAHWAAVPHGGRTIGVLGNGLGIVYPAANRALYEKVTSAGLLLTEHPPGERPHAGSFPARNRLISGLARVTVVVEAAVGSGALITANAGLNQGREVMAVPGPIVSRTSAGTNRLLRDGAAPYLEPEDLLSHYPEIPADVRARFRMTAPDDAVRSRLQADQRRVYETLDGSPREVDAIASELDLAAAEVIGMVSELEIMGLADRVPGGFVRAH